MGDPLMTYLCAEAHLAGVEWLVEDGELMLRGPRSAEPIVRQLLARSEELRGLCQNSGLVGPVLFPACIA